MGRGLSTKACEFGEFCTNKREAYGPIISNKRETYVLLIIGVDSRHLRGLASRHRRG